jgi:hypothetical protein
MVAPAARRNWLFIRGKIGRADSAPRGFLPAIFLTFVNSSGNKIIITWEYEVKMKKGGHMKLVFLRPK